MSVFSAFMDWLRSLFFTKELEITLVGLQNSGKTSLVNVLAAGQFSSEMIPTIGFNMRKVTKGGVTIKLWDLGGQPKFRSMWERYCRGVNAIVFILDASDPSTFDAASAELHALLERPQLAGIPVLILGNKNDVAGALKVGDLIERFELAKIANREISAYSISAKENSNIDAVLSWLTKARPQNAMTEWLRQTDEHDP